MLRLSFWPRTNQNPQPRRNQTPRIAYGRQSASQPATMTTIPHTIPAPDHAFTAERLSWNFARSRSSGCESTNRHADQQLLTYLSVVGMLTARNRNTRLDGS